MPSNQQVTATCGNCGAALPPADTPHVCEICGTSKAMHVVANLDDDTTSLFCTPCMLMTFAKTLNDAMAASEGQPA